MNDSNVTYSNEPCPEDRTGLLAYACFYFGVHGYISFFICCFGIPTNVINIIVLTKKKMRSPINTVLTGIAVADIFTMGTYMVFVLHFNIIHGPERTPEKYTLGWTWFLVIHAGLSVTVHTVSLWLAVVMAIIRYVFIRSMGRGANVLTVPITTGIVVIVYILTVIVYVPYFIHNEVVTQSVTIGNATYYSHHIKNLQLGASNASVLETFAAVIFILIGKVLPCLLITLFGGLLLFSLHESKKRTMTLKGANVDSRMKQHKRTTMMLLAVIVMSIVAEMPAMICVLVGLVDESFFRLKYPLLSDTLDLLALINSSINFILYCVMSRQFRECLLKFACGHIRKANKNYQSVRSQNTNSTAMNTINQNNN